MKKILSILLILPLFCKAGVFYASPTGTGTGTQSAPFGLQSALNAPIPPGDTIYLLAGTYKGTFTSSLTGTIALPILVRNNPGDRVIIDGSRAGLIPKNVAAFTINGAYTNYVGLEVTNSDTVRTINVSGSGPPERRGAGVVVFGVGVKVINFLIYDTGEGISAWVPAINSECYGNIIFNNGWYAPDREHGHGIYTQNDTGVKVFKENIILNNFGYGWHVYTEGGKINNFYLEGNVCFNDRWLMGGLVPMKNIELRSNFSYKNAPEFGYSARGNDGLILTNNFFAYTMYLSWWKNVTATGNTILYNNLPSSMIQINFDSSINVPPNLSTFHFDNNTYYSPNATPIIATYQNRQVTGVGSLTLPQWQAKSQDVRVTIKYFPKVVDVVSLSGKVVFVRPNKYDKDRFTIIIYNWDKSATVNISSGLSVGDSFELRNVQNYFGDVIKGVATGDSLTVPMTGHTVAKPLGYATEMGPNTFPEFGVFVLIRKPAPLQVNQCHNIDSLITLVSIMQGQMVGLQSSVNSALTRISALESQAIGNLNTQMAALQTALTALQLRVTNLKAITIIQ